MTNTVHKIPTAIRRGSRLLVSMRRRWMSRILMILIPVMAACAVAQTQQQVVGYYTMWGTARLPVSLIQFDKITHINHAFAWPTSNGGIQSSSAAVDTGLIGATHRAGRNILISLGGANSGPQFSAMVSNSSVRAAFVNNLVAYVTGNQYDGADFDWEQPGNSADSVNEISLMREVHAAFRAAHPSLLLTMAIGSSPYGGQFRNYDSLAQWVDWFNVMTYDLDQGWSGKSGYNAALYYVPGMGNDYSVDQSFGYLTRTRHLSPAQLVLGVPFYGKRFDGSGTMHTPFTGSIGYPFFYDIGSLAGWTRQWDDAAKVPFLTNGSSVITYDDSLSISLKCQYAIARGMAGIMVWELSQDVLGSSQPLLEVIARHFLSPAQVADRVPNSRPADVILHDPFPNPCNPSTTFRFTLSTPSYVSLELFDVTGRKLAALLEGMRPSGNHDVVFDASSSALPSGVYWCRLRAGADATAKQLVLMR